MSYITFSKRNILAILLGFGAVLVVGLLTSGLSIVTFRVGPTAIGITLGYVTGILTLLSPIIGGCVVGWRVREQGWLYAGWLGVFLVLVSMLLVSITFFLPASMVSSSVVSIEQARAAAKANLLLQVTHAPFLIVVTALGGIVGNWAYLKRAKPKITA